MTHINPMLTIEDEFCIDSRPDPAGMVLFGASGDLVRHKIIPALFNLRERNLLPNGFFVLGCSRSPKTDEDFRADARQAVLDVFPDAAASSCLEPFLASFAYTQGDYKEAIFYAAISRRLESLEKHHSTGGNRLFYCAVPPSVYTSIAEHLDKSGLTHEREDGTSWRRVIFEKPFGFDLESARALDKKLCNHLEEHQIYRIDHYLGKETVQNILIFRFANSIFEPVWNRNYIDSVQITAAENIGIKRRAGYFDSVGVLRDMFQNHLLQLLTIAAIEPPISFDADRVRDEKNKLLRAIRPFDIAKLDESIVRGQYTAGEINGTAVRGYLEENGVRKNSTTETFVALKIFIDNWRWRGVPFYIRSGKRLPEKITEIAITFKPVPHSMFKPFPPEQLQPNVLVFNIQPDDGVSLTIKAKHPGPKLCMTNLAMDFLYKDVFPTELPDAYERLLLEVLNGDQTLFVRNDGMQLAWKLFTPVLDAWREQDENGGRPEPYAAGSYGPPSAYKLLASDGRSWRRE